MRAFEQAAEIFFAGDVFCPFFAGEAGHGFIFHFEPFEANDADVFPALFPDLALAQFHGRHYTNRVRALATRLLRKNRIPARSKKFAVQVTEVYTKA